MIYKVKATEPYRERYTDRQILKIWLEPVKENVNAKEIEVREAMFGYWYEGNDLKVGDLVKIKRG